MIRDFLAAGLIDHMHIVVVPILLGRGVRLWDGLGRREGLRDRGHLLAKRSHACDIHPCGCLNTTASAGDSRRLSRLCNHPLDQPRATLFDLEAAASSRLMKISRLGSVGSAAAPPVD